VKTALLDVNVLIALAWPNHVHHELAQAWFERNRRHGWATCPLTQSSFVRVSSNRHAIPQARSPQEAALLLKQIVLLAGHSFWSDDVAFAASRHVSIEKVVGYRQVTDAHLLALALRRGGRLATLDAGIRSLVPAGWSPAQVVAVLTDSGAVS
jgi:hypothetical protein